MPIPHGHWKTTTFVAGLRNSGKVAPMVLDGPINGIAFQAHVDQVLVPDLRSGGIVIMDSLGSHKRCGRACCDRSGGRKPAASAALQSRPQPDRERLRQAQGMLRKATEQTIEAPCVRIGILIERFTSAECLNFFHQARYVST